MTEHSIPIKVGPVNHLTLDLLREILHYDPETGVFTWKVRRGNRAIPGAQAGSKSTNKPKQRLSIRINGKSYFNHRLAWLYMTGEWPALEIDHIDTDSLNNRWNNLRLATTSQNQANRGPQKNNKSGFKGVYWHPSHAAWRAAVRFKGRKIILGEFRTPEDAHAAYCTKVAELYGEFARTS